MKKSNRNRDHSQLHKLERSAALQESAKEQLAAIQTYLKNDAQDKNLHEVERFVFQQVLKLGNFLMENFLVEKGPGKQEGPANWNGSELTYHSLKSKKYLSIFGTLDIERAYYWQKGSQGCFPLDKDLNLPESCYSYLLQEWGELIGVGQSYDKVTDQLEKFLRIKFWKQVVQQSAGTAACNVQPYYEQKPPPSKEDEGAILVAAIDGKGVPIRQEKPHPQKLRLGRGEKPTKKKEAVVSAV